MLTIIITKENKIPVEVAFKIQIPLPPLANCKNNVMIIPPAAERMAPFDDALRLKSPKNNGAARDTLIRE